MDQPFVLIVAGPNGAGKTTLTGLLRKRGVDLGEYINPDDIAAELQGSDAARAADAQRIADRRRDECIQAARSFSFETVMSHPSKIDVLTRAKAAGFLVQLYFVGIDDPRTNVERVALRVDHGGHDVPEDRIVARWHRTMGLLARAVKAADRAFVFDNSESGPTLNPRLVLQIDMLRQTEATGRQFTRIPPWVRHFVVEPLELRIAP